MLEHYFQSTFTLTLLRNGPSGPWLDGFAGALHQAGYAARTGGRYIRGAHHFGQFLKRYGVGVADAQPDSIAAFRRHVKHCHCPKPRGGRTADTVRGARGFLEYLWEAGVGIRPAPRPTPALVQGFGQWLQSHRGVSNTTRTRYCAAGLELLNTLGPDPGQYDAARLRGFLLTRARQRGVGGTKAISSALRMFLRYLASQGTCRAGLDAAIPALAGWRLASVPGSLSNDEVEQLLSACDGLSPLGRRDRAVILLLARLGLRASDVAALRFAAIDWEDGSLLVTGKSRYEARLPLPQDVGDAILAYLEHRPEVPDEHVFLRGIAPFRRLPGSAVSQIVRRTMRRAGLTAPTAGSHLLRHTAATELLRRGVSLSEIGLVLRHRSADTTASYAKVDRALLQPIAQPWPEVGSC